MILLREHREIIETLLIHQVDFMLIGGYAVISYGYMRTTGDMDLWLKPDNQNKNKFIQALTSTGFEEDDLEALAKLDFTQPQTFTLGTKPQKIDFLTHINQVSFEEADSQKNMIMSGDIQIPVIHLDHLILSKLGTGRLKDNADVEALQAINRK